MREIKFRAWCKKHKVMIYHIGSVNWNEQNEIFVNQDIKCAGNEILMQYTRLKDKNGKEIYEGDIVSMFHDTQFSQVKWNSEYGCWEIKVQLSIHNEGWDLLGNHLEQCEVIGNIYENPELLEGN